MIDWNKPIEDEDGNPARVISRDYRYENEILFVVQIERKEDSLVRIYWQNGYPRFCADSKIRNRKTKREKWIILTELGPSESWFDSAEEAKAFSHRFYVRGCAKAVIQRVDWEE